MMPAGEEMNRLVAFRVVGYTDDGTWPHHFTVDDGTLHERLPQYSQVIADAWFLVSCSKLWVEIRKIGDYNSPRYSVFVHPAAQAPDDWTPAYVEAETMPLALCRAALKMAGVYEYE
jgi:hypothetical protein